MPRILIKRRRATVAERVKELVLEEPLKLVLMVSVSLLVGFIVLTMGLRTFYTVQENRWLESKIEEMKIELANLEVAILNEASKRRTVSLDGN